MVTACIQAVKVFVEGAKWAWYLSGNFPKVEKGSVGRHKGKVICGCVLSG